MAWAGKQETERSFSMILEVAFILILGVLVWRLVRKVHWADKPSRPIAPTPKEY